MKPKQILTFVLLLFIGVSLATVAAKQMKNSSADNAVEKDKTVVYFFHGNKRCKTCNQMERFTHETLENNFSQQLKDGNLEMRLVNLDENGNGHYVSDYAMEYRVVVLSKLVGGKEVKWTRLDQVWELAHEEPVFKNYIRSELEKFLKEEG